MTELKPERIEEFMRIYEVEYKQDLTDIEASDAANRLARLAELMLDDGY